MTLSPNLTKAVILGAAGFMGNNLARALVARKVDTVVFDRKPSAFWPAEARVIIGDIGSPPDALRAQMEEAVVFHLAGTTRPAASTDMIAHEIASSVANTVALLEWSRDCRCRWVFASSGGTVYGQADTPVIAESHPTNPISSYGILKLAAEKYFLLYRALYGTDCVIARIANPYGPFQLPNVGQGLVATLISRLRRSEPIEIWGDGENVRDYMYIDDTIDALMLLASRGASGGTYNVGSGAGTSINHLIDQVAQISGHAPIIYHRPARQIDVRRNVLDARRLAEDTGWAPAYTLQQGLERTCRWFEQNLSDF